MTSLSILPIGGVGETGAQNCMLYEAENASILVDCGVGFAGDRYPGAALYHPDFSCLEPWRKSLKGVVLTHGHEDHVGAVGHFRKRFNIPVYGTPFTLGVARNKLSECGLSDSGLKTIEPGRTFSVGPFGIEPVFVNHSTLDSVALIISAAGRRALHLTDFKIDHAAPEGRVIDLKRLKGAGGQGLDALLLDSTNVFSPGWTASESVIRANLIEHFTRIPGRVLACLFSSNIVRIQSLIECARLTGRRIAFTGRSTREYTRIAKEIGRLETNGVEFHDVEDIARFPDNEILVIVTGSQAERRSVLQRLSQDMFKPFKLREGDTLIMTSRMIPGNEGRILEMLNNVAMRGVEIVSEGVPPSVHASGHAYQDELKEILRLTRPRWFVPIHGEYRHLKKNAELARGEGIPGDRILVIQNGERVTFGPDGARREAQIEIGRTYISEEGVPIARKAITRRKKIGINGLVCVSVVYDRLRRLPMSEVSLDLTAMCGAAEDSEDAGELKAFLKNSLSAGQQLARERLVQLVKVEVRQHYKHKHNLRPEVAVLVNEI